jgi:N-acetylglucosamine-6-phosphate deacetylase
MPHLHHRDPSIIGLLGAFESSPAYTSSDTSTQFTYPSKDAPSRNKENQGNENRSHVSEAFRETVTPPQMPVLQPRWPGVKPSVPNLATRAGGKERGSEQANIGGSKQREKKQSAFERPYYGISSMDVIHTLIQLGYVLRIGYPSCFSTARC